MENATVQHSFRVHLQVVVWKHLNTSVLKPMKRGWELGGNGKLRPKMLTCCIAPYCNCKEGGRQCQTMKCSCMKAGMSCVSACGVCCGHCSNGADMEEVDSDEEESS